MKRWDEAAGERLKGAVRGWGTQDDFCAATDTGRTSLNRYFTGGDPGPDKIARFAEVLAMSIAALLGEGEAAVPVYDIEVAAGAGRDVFATVQPLFHWTFPADWAAANLGDTSALKMFRVAGDSQWPELNDGDLLAIDPRSRRTGEDLHVVRVGSDLKVKRIVLEGDRVRLLSRNELYPEEVVDLAEEGDGFEIIGRVVWASKLY